MDFVVRLAGAITADQVHRVITDVFADADADAQSQAAAVVYVAHAERPGCFVCTNAACAKVLDLQALRPFIRLNDANDKSACVHWQVMRLEQVETSGNGLLHSHSNCHSNSNSNSHTQRAQAQGRANEAYGNTHVRITSLYDTLDGGEEASTDAAQRLRVIAIVPSGANVSACGIEERLGQTIVATLRRLCVHARTGANHSPLTRQRTCPPVLAFDTDQGERRHSHPPDLFYYRSLTNTDSAHCSCRAPRRTVDCALLELCASLYNLTHGELQLKILNYLFDATGAETGCILLCSQDVAELSCTCIKDRLLDSELHFPVSEENFFGRLLANRRPVIVDSLTELSHAHRQDVQFFLAEELRSLMCAPILNRKDSNVVAVVCLANKDNFNANDICAVQRCFAYTMPVLNSVVAFQSEKRLRKQTQSLLKVAKKIFGCVDNLNNLLREIMFEASNLAGAERCSLFVYDNESDELVAKVFEGVQDNGKVQQAMPEVRLSSKVGIVGEVFTKGQVLNIRDAYAHPQFYRGVDEATGFKTRNILCFPLQDESGKIVAVAELCNKQNGPCFTDVDAEIAKAFGVFCCISLSQSLMYKRVHEEHYRAKLANELMTYHMHMHEEGAESLAQLQPRAVDSFMANFTEFCSIPRDLPEKDTLHAVVSMFDDLGLTTQFRINRKTLSRFLHATKLGYRDPPYHNWLHAFSATHFAYLCLKNLSLADYLTDNERFALFVASLCHDIDHRGTNNTFQMVSKSTLACLYSSAGSVLERHHVAQTLCLLNSDGSKILENLSDVDYKIMIDLIREIILATDVANHLRIFKDIRQLTNGRYDRSIEKHRILLLSLLMTSADLSDQTKRWSNSKRASSLLYREFFSQGDLEKQLGHSPALMMDRARACVPELQVSFLDGIAIPVYDTLAELFPRAQSVAAQCKRNRENWNTLLEKLKAGQLKDNVDIFCDPLVDDDLN